LLQSGKENRSSKDYSKKKSTKEKDINKYYIIFKLTKKLKQKLVNICFWVTRLRQKEKEKKKESLKS